VGGADFLRRRGIGGCRNQPVENEFWRLRRRRFFAPGHAVALDEEEKALSRSTFWREAGYARSCRQFYIGTMVGGSAMTRFDAGVLFGRWRTGCPTPRLISIHNMASDGSLPMGERHPAAPLVDKALHHGAESNAIA